MKRKDKIELQSENSKSQQTLEAADSTKNTERILSSEPTLSISDKFQTNQCNSNAKEINDTVNVSPILSNPKKKPAKKLSLFTDFFVPRKRVHFETNHNAGLETRINIDENGMSNINKIDKKNAENLKTRASRLRIKEVKLIDKGLAAEIRKKLSIDNMMKKPYPAKVFKRQVYNYVAAITKTYYSGAFIPNEVSYNRIFRYIYNEVLAKEIYGNFLN